MTSNQIAYWANQEKIRSNKAQEAEMYRHNVEMEKVGYAGAAASRLGAQASMLGAQNARLALEETARHNAATEQYQSYSAYSGGMAGLLQANAATTRAETDEKRYQLEQDMSTYDKWVKGTSAVKNVASSISDILKGVAGVGKSVSGSKGGN